MENEIVIRVDEVFATPLTDVEIAKHKIEAIVQEAKMYLNSTDYKVLPDYEPKDETIIAKRAEARAFIRANDVYSS